MAIPRIPAARNELQAKYTRRKGAAGGSWYDWATPAGNPPVGQTGGATIPDIWTYKSYIRIPALPAGYTATGNIRLQFSRGDSYGNISWVIGLRKGTEPAKTITESGLDRVLSSRFATASLGAYSITITPEQWGSLQQDTYIVFMGYNQDVTPYYSCGNISNTASVYPYVTIPCVNSSTGTLSDTTLEVNGTNSLGVAITAHSPGFTHSVTYRLGAQSMTHGLEAGVDSYSYVIPAAWLAAIPAADSGTLYVDLKTYDDGVQVGDTYTMTCAATVPAYTLTPTRSLTGVGLYHGLYVQGYSGLSLTVTAAGAYGSEITGIVTTADGATVSGAAGSIPTLYGSGELEVKTTVTDSRGKTAEITGSVRVYARSYPVISSARAFRCTAGGAPDTAGTHVKVLLTASVSSINGENSFAATADAGTFTLTGQSCTDASVILTGYGISSEHTVTVTVSDAFGGTAVELYIPSGARIFNIPAEEVGDGIAFGRFADTPDTLYSAWDIYTEGDAEAEGDITAGGAVTGASVEATGDILAGGDITAAGNVGAEGVTLSAASPAISFHHGNSDTATDDITTESNGIRIRHGDTTGFKVYDTVARMNGSVIATNANCGIYGAAVNISGKDAKANRVSGFYMGNNMTNAPEGSADWFYILVMHHNSNYCKLIASRFFDSYLWVCHQDNGNWSTWRRI